MQQVTHQTEKHRPSQLLPGESGDLKKQSRNTSGKVQKVKDQEQELRPPFNWGGLNTSQDFTHCMTQRGFYDCLSCSTRLIFGFLHRSDDAFHLSAVTRAFSLVPCLSVQGVPAYGGGRLPGKRHQSRGRQHKDLHISAGNVPRSRKRPHQDDQHPCGGERPKTDH